MPKKYPDEMVEYCKELSAQFIPLEQQIKLCEQKFGIPVAYYSFLSWRNRNHIAIKSRWTHELKEFVRIQITMYTFNEVARMVRTKFNWPSVTGQTIKSAVARYGFSSGRTGYFKKGHVPHNKGKKPSDETLKKMSATWFSKGHRPSNELPIGAQIYSHDGYLMQKISDDLRVSKKFRWKPVHHIVWEQVNGPIPDGHVVIFLDGNKSNFSIDNLQLVSRAENASMNYWGLRFDNAELTKTGLAITKLKQAVNKKR